MAKRSVPEVSAGAMADISFLLLIFFLVTTQIPNEKGLPIILPPKKDENTIQQIELNDRNVLTILVNSQNQLLVEREPLRIEDLKEKAMEFIDNRGRDKHLSDSPKDAVVSIKTDRGTNYKRYIQVMNAIQAAYNTLRARHMGITSVEYLGYDEKKASPSMKQKYTAAKKEYPLNISEAEQTSVGG
ncbi:hypothetical protein BKI52_44280 [marine bacterium AO1-C]|nr:hypothetical protein BKI52_44280 [marine bacterium AO1-C]